MAWAKRPMIVFDLDHTLVDTNYRTIAILRDVGRELNLPQLLDLQYEQIESLRARDFSPLQITDPKILEKIFGNRAERTFEKSLFGKRFFFDASYFVHDALIPGGPEFVEKLILALDAEVVYLSARFEEYTTEGTIKQLAHFNYPGHGQRSKYKDRTRLILRPKDFVGEIDEFKIQILFQLQKQAPIIAIFDDSRRNTNTFRKNLPPETVVVRIGRDVLNTLGLDPDIEQITNYIFNIAKRDGKNIVTFNETQLLAIIERAQKCSRLFL